MPRLTTPLTATEVKNAKPKDKDYKLTDGQGLYLLIKPNGGKLWRFKYRYNGKDLVIALGKYPEISLADARAERLALRSDVAKGINPSEVRKQKKLNLKSKVVTNTYTFKKIATDYLANRGKLNEDYLIRLKRSLENDVYPFIGNSPFVDVSAKEIANIVLLVQKRGALESAHRLFSLIDSIFKYGISVLIIEGSIDQTLLRNPCNDMDKNTLLKPHTTKNFPTLIKSEEIRDLLHAIDDYNGDYTTRMALTLAPYVALRPYNLRYAEWSEIEFEARQWSIPKEKLKTKNDLIIPLTDTTLSLLQDIYMFSGDGRYIFPGLRSKVSPMSDATLNNALRRMGYSKDELVVHGFRAMFATIANEKSPFSRDVIDTQLAHSVGSKVSQAYNRAMYLDERKELMQWWSDYLDNLKKLS